MVLWGVSAVGVWLGHRNSSTFIGVSGFVGIIRDRNNELFFLWKRKYFPVEEEEREGKGKKQKCGFGGF